MKRDMNKGEIQISLMFLGTFCMLVLDPITDRIITLEALFAHFQPTSIQSLELAFWNSIHLTCTLTTQIAWTLGHMLHRHESLQFVAETYMIPSFVFWLIIQILMRVGSFSLLV